MLANKEIVSASRPSRRHGFLGSRREGRDGEGLPRWSLALLRAVTHEIRSPLTVIRAYSSVALQKKTRLSATEMTDLMRHIDRSARLVEVIVGDLEALAKQESVRMRLVALDLGAFLSDNTPDLQALAPGRRLQVDLDLESLRLRADPVRLKQVLNNLVENAHKYSRPAGQITIRVGQLRDKVLIAVEDEGPGVPAEEVNRIFDPFFRGTRTSRQSGSGLGLAICKSLVEAQGGGLAAAPGPRGGFQMLVTLPAAA
ncbi:MAG TPA: ATP-binding protein [Dehalococcoidia bacterium]|jgi:signal transduction histidine kinase